jgi:hypothetical protein
MRNDISLPGCRDWLLASNIAVLPPHEIRRFDGRSSLGLTPGVRTFICFPPTAEMQTEALPAHHLDSREARMGL